MKKSETINVVSGFEAVVMPRYNTHAVGHGLWKSKKDKTRRAEKKCDRRARLEYCGR